jgi:hypothetical protein
VTKNSNSCASHYFSSIDEKRQALAVLSTVGIAAISSTTSRREHDGDDAANVQSGAACKQLIWKCCGQQRNIMNKELTIWRGGCKSTAVLV